MASQRLRLGPMRRSAVLGALAAGALITAVVIAGRSRYEEPGRTAAGPPSAPAVASAPVSLGPTWSCPLAAPVPAFADHRSYPPGHPGAPPRTLRPVACYPTDATASKAGYPPAPPPAGTLEVGGVYLTPSGTRLQRRCQRAADRLGFPVPCPALLPAMSPGAAPPVLCDEQRFACEEGSGFVLEEDGFVVPPGYAGVAGQAHGRLVAAAGREADPVVVCQGRQRPVATIKTHGLIGRLVECSGAGVHYDSTLVRWRERGAVMVVSVLGHSSLQRRLAMAVAEHIRVVSPARPAP